ncbi:unnamed protein product [Coffea canephora]|uniref:NB-ARC domain-containing protein n=1 Tax=Coffea canephora TaxID=49390 RepID=A0A068V4K8_COFCA|nr:unnamed protein product [Coffea canephora]
MAINFACGKIGQSSELEKDLENLKRTLTLIQDVLHDAEKRQVNERSVKHWLENLELENQNQRKRKLGLSFSRSDSVEFHSNMASQIQEINANFTSINEQASKLGLQPHNRARDAPALSPLSGGGFMENRETDSVTVDTGFVGRDDDVSAIVTELTATSNNETISVLPIVGMGGIGKTTVARKVFNIPNIENHFDKRMWVCVSDIEKHFDANRIFGLMLEKLGVPMAGVAGSDSREARVQKLKEILDGKKPLKYLLVLDDVWDVSQGALWAGFLDSLRGISSAKGSWVIVTTRNKRVANITAFASDPWPLKVLSNDDCWLIISKNAFRDREAPGDLKELGLELAKKCQGLPLAASVLGGMLRIRERNEWQSILDTGLQNIGGDEDGDITKILKLSFDHLPYPSLKKCFAYCSIFPQDFEMERNQLIQLWAAEGFLHSNPRNRMSMEEVGNKYFTILLERNLFQDAKEDDYGNVLNCKMHDLVHDMVQFISDSKTLRLTESSSIDMETSSIRYLALERSEKEMPFPSTESFKRITTLFLQGNRSLNDREMSFFMLRVLNLRASSVEELPKSIGKLTHLRYLALLGTSIKILPESLCQLYNLQTLRGKYYYRPLAKFPKNFKNLVNLRHFDFFSMDKSSDIMPFEIGQLQFLQTLPFFNIGEERGRQIGELRNLKNLSGQLELRNLELVKSKKEAESANLIGKPNIDELKLLWNEIGNSRNNDSEYNQVLEGLQAHQNLKGLIIERFYGSQLSPWIGKLGKLVKFELRNCKSCKELPTLGNMPFLRFLHLDGLDSLASIGPSFYGRSGVHSGSTSQGHVNLFPALEDLSLGDMPNLREWMEATVDDGTVVVFPVLHTMRINNCPQLATFPNYFPRLEELNIRKTQNGSALMTYICSGVSTLTRLFVENVNGLTKVPNVLFQNNHKLAHLWLNDCGDLTQFLDFSFEVPQTSEGPNLYECPNLISVPIDLTRTPSLSSLSISKCKELTDLPKGKLCSLTRLRQLYIGPFSETTTELHSFLDLFDALPPPHPYFPSLSILWLYGWPHWESLPKQLQHLSALTTLGLYGFGVKSLPDWFEKLSSLEELDLDNCKKLENLPSHQSMRSLTRLRGLWIRDCPLLKERCNPVSSSSSSSSSDSMSECSQIMSVSPTKATSYCSFLFLKRTCSLGEGLLSSKVSIRALPRGTLPSSRYGEYFEAIHLLVADCLRAGHLMYGLKTCFEVFLCVKSCDHKLFSQSDGAITRLMENMPWLMDYGES